MVNRYLAKSLCFLVLALSTACGSKSFDTSKELWAYLNETENGYRHTKNINGMACSLTYKPTDLLVQQALGERYDIDDVKRLRKKYGKYLYFDLSLSADGQEILNQKKGNQTEFGIMVNQLVFGMNQKVNLITQARDTLLLLDYVYPRMYGMGKSADMLLVYEYSQEHLNQEYLRFTLEDIGLGTGEIAFKLATEKIRNQPKLTF